MVIPDGKVEVVRERVVIVLVSGQAGSTPALTRWMSGNQATIRLRNQAPSGVIRWRQTADARGNPAYPFEDVDSFQHEVLASRKRERHVLEDSK